MIMNVDHLKQRLINILKNNSHIWFLNRLLGEILYFRPKISNYFLGIYEYQKKKDFLNSFPTEIALNTTNLCNLRCLFCEIHYFYDFAKEKSGKVFPNNLTPEFVSRFNKLFDRVINIELSGASGEPLLNPYFIPLCRKLKQKHIVLSTTTNATLLDKNLAKELINMQFDHLMVSLHSGEEQNYQELQGGDFNKIIENLKNIIELKKVNKSFLPEVSVNTLIFTLNQHSIIPLLDKLKEIGIQKVNINQYYASRNKIKGKVSFYFFPERGNIFLKDLYAHAKSIGLILTPEQPNFIYDRNFKNLKLKGDFCQNPWNQLKLKGCIEYGNRHYVGVCNRIMLFRLNYEEFNGDFNKDIWNHEIIRYFRKNVMKNPICEFCKNPNTPKLRSYNNKQYQIERDNAINKFLEGFFKKIKPKPIRGIYLLKSNPYEYKAYYDKV